MLQATRDTVLSAPAIQLSQMTDSMCQKERVDSWKQHLAREVQMNNKTEKPELRACGRQREPSPASFKSNCSDCSISHTYMSCSPQLPFALTPASTSHSLLQRSGEKLLGGHSYRQDSHFDSSADPAAANLVIGRDVSDLALIRRSSWSAKSFLHSELHWLGQSPCSFSPSPTADIYPCVAGASSSASQLFSGGAGVSPFLPQRLLQAMHFVVCSHWVDTAAKYKPACMCSLVWYCANVATYCTSENRWRKQLHKLTWPVR